MMDVFRFFLTLGKLYSDKHIVNAEGTFSHFLEKEYFFFSFHLALTKINGCFVPIVMIHEWVVLIQNRLLFFSIKMQ